MNYITLNAQKVLDACNLYLNRRSERIHQKREEMIEKTMNGFFGAKTREKAIERLDNEDPFSPWHRVAIKGMASAELVEELKSLAVVAVDNDTPVNLDSKTAHILEDYFV